MDNYGSFCVLLHGGNQYNIVKIKNTKKIVMSLPDVILYNLNNKNALSIHITEAC